MIINRMDLPLLSQFRNALRSFSIRKCYQYLLYFAKSQRNLIAQTIKNAAELDRKAPKSEQRDLIIRELEGILTLEKGYVPNQQNQEIEAIKERQALILSSQRFIIGLIMLGHIHIYQILIQQVLPIFLKIVERNNRPQQQSKIYLQMMPKIRQFCKETILILSLWFPRDFYDSSQPSWFRKNVQKFNITCKFIVYYTNEKINSFEEIIKDLKLNESSSECRECLFYVKDKASRYSFGDIQEVCEEKEECDETDSVRVGGSNMTGVSGITMGKYNSSASVEIGKSNFDELSLGTSSKNNQPNSSNNNLTTKISSINTENQIANSYIINENLQKSGSFSVEHQSSLLSQTSSKLVQKIRAHRILRQKSKRDKDGKSNNQYYCSVGKSEKSEQKIISRRESRSNTNEKAKSLAQSAGKSESSRRSWAQKINKYRSQHKRISHIEGNSEYDSQTFKQVPIFENQSHELKQKNSTLKKSRSAQQITSSKESSSNFRRKYEKLKKRNTEQIEQVAPRKISIQVRQPEKAENYHNQYLARKTNQNFEKNRFTDLMKSRRNLHYREQVHLSIEKNMEPAQARFSSVFQSTLFLNSMQLVTQKLFRKQSLKINRKKLVNQISQPWSVEIKSKSKGSKLELKLELLCDYENFMSIHLLQPRNKQILLEQGKSQYLFDFQQGFSPIVLRIQDQDILVPISAISMLKIATQVDEDANKIEVETGQITGSSCDQTKKNKIYRATMKVDTDLYKTIEDIAKPLKLNKDYSLYYPKQEQYSSTFKFYGQILTLTLSSMSSFTEQTSKAPAKKRPLEEVNISIDAFNSKNSSRIQLLMDDLKRCIEKDGGNREIRKK